MTISCVSAGKIPDKSVTGKNEISVRTVKQQRPCEMTTTGEKTEASVIRATTA
jgi:hypothetical protein